MQLKHYVNYSTLIELEKFTKIYAYYINAKKY